MKRKETIVVIGAGAVGSGIALAARSSGHTVASIVSRTPARARSLAKKVGARTWGSQFKRLPETATLFIIAVPDPEIATVVSQLSQGLASSRRRRKVFHTSGPSTSDLLRPLKRFGFTVCSIHPIHSFPSVHERSVHARSLRGEWFGIEGSRSDRVWARSFVRTLGGRTIDIPKSKKTLYHIACTFASNYPLVLLRGAGMLAASSRLKGGLQPLKSLLFDSLQNGLRHGPMRSLTGPVARGDGATLRRHRAEIRKIVPHLAPLFDELIVFASLEAERSGRISRTQGHSVRKAIKR